MRCIWRYSRVLTAREWVPSELSLFTNTKRGRSTLEFHDTRTHFQTLEAANILLEKKFDSNKNPIPIIISFSLGIPPGLAPLPCESLTHLDLSGVTPILGSHEALESEIKRLRERLHTVETENVLLSSKLSQQQWDLENRLADIEMQLCGPSSASSVDGEPDVDEVERNRESII